MKDKRIIFNLQFRRIDLVSYIYYLCLIFSLYYSYQGERGLYMM